MTLYEGADTQSQAIKTTSYHTPDEEGSSADSIDERQTDGIPNKGNRKCSNIELERLFGRESGKLEEVGREAQDELYARHLLADKDTGNDDGSREVTASEQVEVGSLLIVVFLEVDDLFDSLEMLLDVVARVAVDSGKAFWESAEAVDLTHF